MRKNFLLYIIVISIILFAGCDSNPPQNYDEENASDNNVTIHEEKPSLEYDVYIEEHIIDTDDNSFSVSYAQVSNLGDSNLESNINQALRKAATEWLTDDCAWFEGFQLDIKYKSPVLLSICYTAEWENENGDDFMGTVSRIGITIDMMTGEQIHLTDIFSGENDLESLLVNYKYDSEFSSPINDEEADEIIHEASISIKEYLDEKNQSDPLTYDFIKSYISEKSSFYLEDNMLVVTRDEFEINDIYLEMKTRK